MRHLTPGEVQQLLAESAPFTLLDVRTPQEIAFAKLPGAVCIPLNELPARHQELPRDKPVVAYCHHGVRSETAGRFLEQSGFAQVGHMVGGIDAWSQTIDPSVPRY